MRTLSPDDATALSCAALTPALQQLATVTDILSRNRGALSQTINNLAPFVRVFTNTLGNGRWFDSFVENLLPGAVASVVCGSTQQVPGGLVSCDGAP